MISGNFKKWYPVWESSDNSVRVEKTEPSFKDRKDENETITIDVPALDEDEDESETEDCCEYDYIDESETIASEDMTWDVTIPAVNNEVYGYNNQGKLKKIKIKSNTLKII